MGYRHYLYAVPKNQVAEIDVVRCNNCKWFSNDTECKNCADIDYSCGYCRYFCACVRDDGYCYHGERSEINGKCCLV